MSFTDYLFFPFLAVVFALYYFVPRSWRWVILLLASLAFYATYGIELFPFIIFSTLVSWLAARRMTAIYAEAGAQIKAGGGRELNAAAKKRSRRILIVSVTLILLALVFVKTQRMLLDVPVLSRIPWFFSKAYHRFGKLLRRIPLLSALLKDDIFSDHERMAGTVSILVPLGISYYSFSLIAYLADVYWKKEASEKNFFRLLTFAVFFPKILQGPISRHKSLGPQLAEGHVFDHRRFCYGLQRMLWGFFKKLVIADRLALLINPVFENYADYSGSVLLVAAIFGTFQMYCDFSGCMDIALGISEALGLRLEENFSRPFFSQSVAEFWRRWHMSLSGWFKDYVYLPMVISPWLIRLSGAVKKRWGKRAGKAVMTIVPTLTIWLLTGLWHGTGWNFIVWGLYWAVLMLISSLFEPELRRLTAFLHIDTASKAHHVFCVLRTFFLYVVARVITLSGTLPDLAGVIRRIFRNFGVWCLFDGSLYTAGSMDRPNFQLAVLALCFLLWVSLKQEKGVVLRERIAELNVFLRWTVYLAGIFAVLVFGIYGPGYKAASFIYMGY